MIENYTIRPNDTFGSSFGEQEIIYEPQIEIYVDSACTILWNGKFRI